MAGQGNDAEACKGAVMSMNPGFLPYGRQSIDNDDIKSVVEVLQSSCLTSGPCVERFENAICSFVGAKHGVAVSSGTAALHAAMFALGIGPGDEVIVPPMTFAASANCVMYQGGTPVFADVEEGTLLIDPLKVEKLITPATRAIIGVDYAGYTCDWDSLKTIADKYGLALVADSCHALGAEYKGRKAGTLADMTIFSFHPVKHITTGEGGMVVTDDECLANRARIFRNHGISSTATEREKAQKWSYDMTGLGYNYRITDLQCALGISQLSKLPAWLNKREQLACLYDSVFEGTHIKPLKRQIYGTHAWHLYVVRVPRRDLVFQRMRSAGIGVNVHYKPVYLHSYYQEHGYEQGLCPVAEDAFNKILTLPLWPGMTKDDVKMVCDELFLSLR